VTLYMGLDRFSTIMGFVAFYGYVEALRVQETSQSIKDNCELVIGRRVVRPPLATESRRGKVNIFSKNKDFFRLRQVLNC